MKIRKKNGKAVVCYDKESKRFVWSTTMVPHTFSGLAQFRVIALRFGLLSEYELNTKKYTRF